MFTESTSDHYFGEETWYISLKDTCIFGNSVKIEESFPILDKNMKTLVYFMVLLVTRIARTTSRTYGKFIIMSHSASVYIY